MGASPPLAAPCGVCVTPPFPRPPVDPGPVPIGFAGSIGRSCFSDLVLRAAPELDTAYRSGSRRGLLAALAAGEVAVAVYPGLPEAHPAIATAPLCEDRVAVALRAAHSLAGSAPLAPAALRGLPGLLLVEDGEGEVRRLVRAALPGLDWVAELPPREAALRLAASDAVALVVASQAEELDGGLVRRDLAGIDTRFTVQASWRAAAPDPRIAALVAALRDAAER